MKASHDNSWGAHPGIAGRIAQSFIDSKLSLLIVIASLLLGVFAVVMLPREEEPQIKVPMVDVSFNARLPGEGSRGTRHEADGEIALGNPGVEYIYSTSSEGQSLAIVRFKVS